MAKVQIKSERITPLGGIFHVRELFPLFVGPVIDKVLSHAKCLTLKNVESKTAFKDGQNRRINFVGITGACSEA